MSHPGKQQPNIKELKARIEGLSPMGIRFVARLIDSLSCPPRSDVTSTWITSSPEWVEYFGLAISVHHSNTVEPLGFISFEVAFRNACEAVEWEVDEPGSATRRFVDLTVQPKDHSERKLSLKSTAAQRLSATTAHISKLTEAAWIQDVRSARTRRLKTLELFRQYREAVDAIVMLRTFRSGRDVVPTNTSYWRSRRRSLPPWKTLRCQPSLPTVQPSTAHTERSR